jgi:hypothetical protein
MAQVLKVCEFTLSVLYKTRGENCIPVWSINILRMFFVIVCIVLAVRIVYCSDSHNHIIQTQFLIFQYEIS